MASPVEVAGDVVTGASAISGLLLVYIGALSSSFATFQPQERRTVSPSYQRRAWFAFVGLVFFLVSVTLAIIGKWAGSACVVIVAISLLFIGLGWILVVGILSVLEIK